jgi:cytochrome c-type biogenesis protein
LFSATKALFRQTNTHLVFTIVVSLLFSLSSISFFGVIQDTEVIASTAASQSSLPGQEIRPAPKYGALTLEGKPASLESFQGKPVLINVWATWCVPCRQEMPALESLHNKFSDQGLQIVGVSIDGPSTAQRIKSFIDRMGITYNILHDPDDKFSRAFRTIGVPESFLINANGEIVHTWKGPFDAMSTDTQAKVQNVLSSNTGEESIDSTTNIKPNTDTNSTLAIQSQANQESQSSQEPSSENKPIPSISSKKESSADFQTVAYPIAFGAGILSFLSPCILPLIPSFVAFITGMSIEELTGKNTTRGRKKDSKKEGGEGIETKEDPKLETNRTNFYSSIATSTGLSEASKSSSSYHISTKHTALIRGLLFIAGFSVVFVALGASITALGALFFDYGRWIEIIGGILLVVFGLHLLGVVRIPGTEREWKFHFSKRPIAGHIGSFVIGMGFGAGWTPCIGPILASILAIAASSASLSTGVTLLAVYSAGLAVPFIISTVAVEKFITVFKQIRRWIPWINRTSAALLIIVGIMLLTGILTTLTGALAGLGMPLNLG